MARKIAIIYQGAKYYGGIETYLDQLFKGIDRSVIELNLISLGEWEITRKFRDRSEKVLSLPYRWWNIFQIIYLARILKRNKIELIVSQGLVSNFYGRLASLISGVPSLVTIHSDYRYDFQGLKKFLYKCTFISLNFVTKRFIVVSDCLKKEAIRLGVPEEKIKVIYNGVDDIGVQKKETKKPFIIGSLGRLHHKKGYHLLINAIKLLPEYDFKLYIWGDGDEKNNLLKIIEENKLEGKVILKGFEKNIKKSLSETNLYVQPSLEEGFGLTVAEAMFAEKPIIITPAGSLPELITNGETGLITSEISSEALAKTIKDYLDNQEKYNNLGKNAREAAIKRFSIDVWLKQTEKEYLKASEVSKQSRV